MGFALGPRLNAAGRLTDMSLGIECLITDDFARAMNIAQELDQLNRQRRSIEEEMKDSALATLEFTEVGEQAGISLYEADWHQGVIGIVAGRIKERAHRPTIAFAPSGDGELKGSGRSIPALHLRDALDLISKRQPDLILKFGGHAMAAGLSIREADYPRFAAAFASIVNELLTPADLQRQIETDGALEAAYMSLDMARTLEAAIWGQGFAQPIFDDVFEVETQRILKERHLKLRLRKGNALFDAIQFNCAESVPKRIRAAYRLAVNEYNGVASVQLMLEHFEPA
jgi:single-stranded-DNA-specific exonuclease